MRFGEPNAKITAYSFVKSFENMWKALLQNSRAVIADDN